MCLLLYWLCHLFGSWALLNKCLSLWFSCVLRRLGLLLIIIKTKLQLGQAICKICHTRVYFGHLLLPYGLSLIELDSFRAALFLFSVLICSFLLRQSRTLSLILFYLLLLWYIWRSLCDALILFKLGFLCFCFFHGLEPIFKRLH